MCNYVIVIQSIKLLFFDYSCFGSVKLALVIRYMTRIE